MLLVYNDFCFLECIFLPRTLGSIALSTYPDKMDDKGPMMIALCWIFTIFALLFVGARLYVRAVVHGKLGFDDYIIIFSCVGTLHTHPNHRLSRAMEIPPADMT